MSDFIMPVNSGHLLGTRLPCDGSFHQYLDVLSRTPHDEYAIGESELMVFRLTLTPLCACVLSLMAVVRGV